MASWLSSSKRRAGRPGRRSGSDRSGSLARPSCRMREASGRIRMPPADAGRRAPAAGRGRPWSSDRSGSSSPDYVVNVRRVRGQIWARKRRARILSERGRFARQAIQRHQTCRTRTGWTYGNLSGRSGQHRRAGCRASPTGSGCPKPAAGCQEPRAGARPGHDGPALGPATTGRRSVRPRRSGRRLSQAVLWPGSRTSKATPRPCLQAAGMSHRVPWSGNPHPSPGTGAPRGIRSAGRRRSGR